METPLRTLFERRFENSASFFGTWFSAALRFRWFSNSLWGPVGKKVPYSVGATRRAQNTRLPAVDTRHRTRGTDRACCELSGDFESCLGRGKITEDYYGFTRNTLNLIANTKHRQFGGGLPTNTDRVTALLEPKLFHRIQSKPGAFQSARSSVFTLPDRLPWGTFPSALYSYACLSAQPSKSAEVHPFLRQASRRHAHYLEAQTSPISKIVASRRAE